jgi:hypothetical protein
MGGHLGAAFTIWQIQYRKRIDKPVEKLFFCVVYG